MDININTIISTYGFKPYCRFDKNNTWRNYAKPKRFFSPLYSGIAYATDGYQDLCLCGETWILVTHSTVLKTEEKPSFFQRQKTSNQKAKKAEKDLQLERECDLLLQSLL